ncbi:hypothetical protein VCHC57A2_0977, partial [Vibrio cholerae HC-57A2]
MVINPQNRKSVNSLPQTPLFLVPPVAGGDQP